MEGSYLGPSFTNIEVKQLLDNEGAVYQQLDNEKLFQKLQKFLKVKKLLAGFRGGWNLVQEH